MSEIKIMYLDRIGNDFTKAEKEIKKMIDDGWKLISVSSESVRTFKLIVTFQR